MDTNEIAHQIDYAVSFSASGARLLGGLYVHDKKYGVPNRPPIPIELYEFENCPYCRIVRDAITMLGLQATIYPCPEGGERFRQVVRQKGGKEQFPYMVDPNTGREMYESDDIIAYLYQTYGDGNVPLVLKSWLAIPTSHIISGLRIGKGTDYRQSKAPEKLLTLYGFEESPTCRIVREVLCELALPYRLINLGKAPGMNFLPIQTEAQRYDLDSQATSIRRAFVEKSGKMQVPYLEDPNTGVAMFESFEIKNYLIDTYAV